jgi:hypothetical protein
MPNWVYNNLKIKDSQDVLEKIRENLINKNIIDEEEKDEQLQSITFQNIIPRPPEEEDWYHWNINNWGTKWDACSASFELKSNELIYNFDTAWSAPNNVILFLSKMYPTANITHTYEEEQGWGAKEEYNNGVANVLKTWDIPASHKDIIERGGECYCNDQELYFNDCFSERSKNEKSLSEDEIKVAVVLGNQWSGSYEELLATAKKL